jgi:hypothetical protein
MLLLVFVSFSFSFWHNYTQHHHSNIFSTKMNDNIKFQQPEKLCLDIYILYKYME